MTICAIYARVSDESQLRGDSLQHQIAYCREHARRRSLEEGAPWTTPEDFVYVDEGITGTSMVRRPAVQRLLMDARRHQFDVVLFKGISRFARDTVDALVMLRALMASGVRVLSMEENFDSARDSAEFIFTIHSALAQAESEKTAIRVRVGAAQKARLGQWNGQPPDGYILDVHSKHLVVDETVALTIRDIFAMYLEGYGVRKIAEALNQAGRYTKRGCLWTQRHVSRVLRNPVYQGDVVYGRREKRLVVPDASNPLSRRKRAVYVADSDQLTVCQDAHPGIVPREVFLQVQARLQRQRVSSGPTGNQQWLTKGLLRCTCGSRMTITYNRAGTAYYRCARRRERGASACQSGHIRALALEQAVLSQVRKDLLELIPFERLTCQKLPEHDTQRELRNLHAALERQFAKSQKLFDEYTDGILEREQYERLNQEIQRRIRALEQAKEKLHAVLQKDNQVVDAGELARQTLVNHLSKQTPNPHLTKEILALFVDRVQVCKGVGQHREIAIHYRFHCPF
ncbi:recombinase family protein [Alicyclobacillus acidoterrestris]|uniref:Recombinase family protein n=1 Tax=Alicyclobacillus acidoterrestris (strain ATCC 49025 / DSM 3922 / CIP 106132 / NCIMB 13137 / GD3B) TaxID=1356854 RepID=T0D5U1_ALIAG|nr:recombinase family protein [Alicyclobacillus acidoterrestris]EPZ45086.1 hypothetical protein N007_09765 [Alicyclobacillus acidoterrestris ATCC 49025]UNO48373.1 recombinase family protein [Alicyclobacillus acidoterrestris]